MDTYDEIYLKCSSMYINILMSMSNITDSTDGNQLHVIDSLVRNKQACSFHNTLLTHVEYT